tara:strand:+ start:1562 stop:1789 length:228 start_codon:yes stop_codon:yes gene_type:complete
MGLHLPDISARRQKDKLTRWFRRQRKKNSLFLETLIERIFKIKWLMWLIEYRKYISFIMIISKELFLNWLKNKNK